jgi:chemotaxis family two-component system sensor kinase Cph1
MFNTSLINCHVEPIQIPGKIQSYGFLVVVNKQYQIVYCSENISSFLGVLAEELLAKPINNLEELLSDHHNSGYLTTLLHRFTTQKNTAIEKQFSIQVNSLPYNLLISKADQLFILEFEPEQPVENPEKSAILVSSLSEIFAENSVTELLENSAIQIKEIIAYDRVMIYKFHDDGHGEVVSEAKEDGLQSWKGQHYPASDIPIQARELYKINLTRQIADVHSEPSCIAGLKENETANFDMTHIAMRAVSPIHIQYLKNMGVASSFSISLLYRGELWGLVACHSYKPRFINFKARNSAKFIGQVISSALSYRQLQEDHEKANKYNKAIDTIGINLLGIENIPAALFNSNVSLLDVVPASGALLYYEHKLYTTGKVPDDGFCRQLIDWVITQIQNDLYETNCLSKSFSEATKYKECASGILACLLSSELKEVLIWFRPEVLSSMTWAGNPHEAVTIVNVDGLSTIHPRTSFANWTEDIKLSSLQWKNEEMQEVRLLREKIVSAISRKANEQRLLNTRLKEAYDELDAFSYTLSHDLKNPLTSIISFSQLLERSKSINDMEKKMVSRILTSAEKMHFMIDDILNYSRAGEKREAYQCINMKDLLQDLLLELMSANGGVEINVEACVDIYGDKTMIMQVFSNLIGNAVKYSKKAVNPKIEINSFEIGANVQYSVTDNGIGIPPDQQNKIFELFSRSNNVGDFEGTGVGLSIVKKIVDRHQGNIWVESDGSCGSTFYVSFLKKEQMKVVAPLLS